jgi:hypothetical protein
MYKNFDKRRQKLKSKATNQKQATLKQFIVGTINLKYAYLLIAY